MSQAHEPEGAHSPDKIIQEYEELIDLAGESSQTIDHVSQIVERTRVSVFSIIGVAYALMGGVGAAALASKPTRLDLTRFDGFLFFAGIALAVVLVAALLYLAFTRSLLLRRYRNTLETEREIHDRLMSLIDQQKRRVDLYDLLSPVAMATLDMKVMRLDRTK